VDSRGLWVAASVRMWRQRVHDPGARTGWGAITATVTVMSTLIRLARRLAPAGGLIAGYALDRLFGDPQRWHPVAGFGRAAGRLEQTLYADGRARGVAFTAVAVGAPVIAGVLLERTTRSAPLATGVFTAATTWVVLGGRTLAREAEAVADHLGAEDLSEARRQVARLVGRDTDELDASGVARAAVESVAENTADAVVAPLVWGAVAGLPGLLGYRAINTLDAMVGHRSPRYRSFGWASARLDDLANWVPARLTATLAVLAAPWVGGSPRRSAAVVVRDAGAHPSPNAGVVEGAFAGALGVRLGGRNTYGGAASDRGTLGDGRAPGGNDIARATRLATMVGDAALVVAVAVRLARG
jgi:adenosylcobinamide-phosphate synthase